MREEPFLDLETTRDKVVPASHMRSTLICSSMQILRSRKELDRYLSLHTLADSDALRVLSPGTWVPIDLAVRHYDVIDRLALADDVMADIGAENGIRLNQSILSVAAKLSKEAGVDPWWALGRVRRLRDVIVKGSDVAVWKRGPKEARFEWIGIPFAGSRYFRAASGGYFRASLELFCRKAYVTLIGGQSSATTLCFRVSWV